MTAVLFLLMQDSGEQFYKFSAGTTWEYVEERGKNKTKSVLTVKEIKDGKTIIESKEYAEGAKEPEVKTVATYAQDGHVIWAEEVEGKLEERIRLFKIGSKKGDTWTSDMGGDSITISNLGTEEVKVGAGTYKDAVHLGFESGDDMSGKMKCDYWMAPGVGLIKFEMSSGEAKMTMECTKFEKK